MIPSLLLAAHLAAGQPAESAHAFVTRLYAAYADENFSPFRKPGRIFTPDFAAALRETQRLSRDEVGFLDGDPICQCQDSSGLSASITGMRYPRSGTAEAVVVLHLGTDRRDLSLKLIRTSNGWRIADIAAANEPSYLGDLQAWNRRKRSER